MFACISKSWQCGKWANSSGWANVIYTNTQNRMFEFRVSFCPRFAKGFFAKGCTTQAVFNCCSKQKSKHNLKLAGSHRMWSDLQNQLNQVHPDQERWCLPKCRVLHRPASLNLILELQTQKFLSATQKCKSDIFTAKVNVSVYKGVIQGKRHPHARHYCIQEYHIFKSRG